jgi:small subunit ribosomal protein S2
MGWRLAPHVFKNRQLRFSREMTKTVSLKDLLEAGSHFGHQAQRWNPKMKPYLFGVQKGVHVFDLVKTKEGLEAASAFVKATAAKGGKIVFVGTKRQAREIVREEAKKAGFPYVEGRWLGGTITNWEQIKKDVNKLAQMGEEKEKGIYKKYTKKEQALLDKEIKRLESLVGGLIGLEELPEAIFVVDVKKEKTAVKEAAAKKVPVVAIVDTNSDPGMVDYVIPANDDAVGSVRLIVAEIAQAAKEGKEIFEKKNKKND